MKGQARAFVLCLLVFSCSVWAQGRAPVDDTGTRSVEGRVTDASGQPAVKAVLQLKNTKTLQIRSFITGGDGRYHFAALSGDTDYQLKAERGGVSTSWKTISLFNTKKVVVINFKLKR
ncbi:MAG TPA: carboxypeptidase-like regulatory domain-containing protein [Bryobacteraceae bacterium]|nr:carboxypeptidase-like regulatory domain-containing protein [Bryobacteraceae bacterium]